jgi:hypothetical protein
MDNLIRRELKVANPSDPMQIASALLERYKSDPRAQAIAQEARGLPFLQVPTQPVVVQAQPTSSAAEWQQASDDVENDLRALSSDAILKDVRPELEGWTQAIRSAMREGYNAARFALDPRNRDKCFGIRRQLNDYARAARLIGALTVSMTTNYRKLAQSLDEAAAVLLVTMGEALSNFGLGGGRFFLQAPYTELQIRRDAAIYALRNLVGATQQAYGPNDWPRGLDAYRSLYKALDEQGQGDLRALLEEGELARTMDELIQRAANGNVEGLRALGSTAQIDLNRFRRLVAVSHRITNPQSPPLAAFLEAVMLFIDAFDSAGGIRLLRIARPPILLYGLYGQNSQQLADRRLLRLIEVRGFFANQIDCFTACACTDGSELCQIVLDKVLYDVDRAIDLYALGEFDFGEPERRASAFSFVVDAALLQTCDLIGSATPGQRLISTGGSPCSTDGAAASSPPPQVNTILASLRAIRGLLRPVLNDTAFADVWQDTPTAAYVKLLPHSYRHQELCIQRDAEMRLADLVQTMAPGCLADGAVFGTPNGVIQRLMRQAMNLSKFDLFVTPDVDPTKPVTVSPGDPNAGIGQILAEFNAKDICALINRDADCDGFAIRIPPHFETSLDSLVHDVPPTGASI